MHYINTVLCSLVAMQAMDLYDVAEGYPSTVGALKRIKCPVLVNMDMCIMQQSHWHV